MSIDRGRTTTTEGAHASLVGILSFLLFLSWWRALKRRSNHPETVWIPLEARHLNSFKNSFKETCKYIFFIHTRWYDHLFLVACYFECLIQCFPLHLMFWSKFQKVIDLRSQQGLHFGSKPCVSNTKVFFLLWTIGLDTSVPLMWRTLVIAYITSKSTLSGGINISLGI